MAYNLLRRYAQVQLDEGLEEEILPEIVEELPQEPEIVPDLPVDDTPPVITEQQMLDSKEKAQAAINTAKKYHDLLEQSDLLGNIDKDLLRELTELTVEKIKNKIMGDNNVSF